MQENHLLWVKDYPIQSESKLTHDCQAARRRDEEEKRKQREVDLKNN